MFKNNYWRNMPKYSGFTNKKLPQNEQFCSFCGSDPMVRLTGVEPAHTASEAAALSTELQAHIKCRIKHTIDIITEKLRFCKRKLKFFIKPHRNIFSIL